MSVNGPKNLSRAEHQSTTRWEEGWVGRWGEAGGSLWYLTEVSMKPGRGSENMRAETPGLQED
jgi:hypothetical protein